MAIQLEWGQTPWDTLSRDDLLREVERLYCALSACSSILRINRGAEPASPFWGERGSGGKALAMADQIQAVLDARFDPESVYRAFFRYARSLLFDVPASERWFLCETCQTLLGGRDFTGAPCEMGRGDARCTGTMRALEWRDLETVPTA